MDNVNETIRNCVYYGIRNNNYLMGKDKVYEKTFGDIWWILVQGMIRSTSLFRNHRRMNYE